MIEKEELSKERVYLQTVFAEIKSQVKNAELSLEKFKEYLREQITYSADSFYNMDEEELSATKSLLENQELEVLKKQETLNRLKLLQQSAYFGRIDFNNKPYYIGRASLLSKDENLYVSDWRAPISSLYYDYELGNVKYNSPQGEIAGKITKKRQYKVNFDDLVYAFDSSLTIGDEILKETLSAGASEKMKNIVSTIQKEQNKIIRNSDVGNLLIQGQAGSGKTSIALHRAAYLLYKDTNKYKSNDIMIISPNKLFSEYISNILPELGERNIVETTFNDIASKEIPKIRLFNRDESINKALEDENFASLVAYKNSVKFFEDLKKFLSKFSLAGFHAQDVKLGAKIIKKETIQELYLSKYKSKKVAVRLGWIADYIIDELNLPKQIYSRVLSVVYNMFSKKSMTEIYADFLKTQGIKTASVRSLYFEDVPAVLYIKDYVLGLENTQKIKYLIIDEMQDYNFIHYEIFNKLFDCNKLIIGDVNQNIFDIYSEQDLPELCKLIGECNLVKLTKSYRSTYEISKFCQKIKGLDYKVIDRHGKAVEMIATGSEKSEIQKISEILKANPDKKIALICKTQQEAIKYYGLLKDKVEISLADGDLELSADKLVISSANSKGIEFDIVVIPNFTKNNYCNERDNNILYVSATRALHELYITSSDVEIKK